MADFQFCEYSIGDEIYAAALHLRNGILRVPLGLDLSAIDYKDDASQRHFGFVCGERIVASVTIKPLHEGLVKLRQMCVDTEAQGTGLGRRLIEQVERVLAADGVVEIELAARANVVPFYERLGYQRVGEEFLEVTIPHQKMMKRLIH